MAETSNQQKSKFIASFRLKPSQSFAGLQAHIIMGDGYELSFRDGMVWIRFDATSDEWRRRLDIGTQTLRTILAILTIQTQYAFGFEPIQWIEDKPRDETGTANYVVGVLRPDLIVQKEPPPVGIAHIRNAEIYAHLSSRNAYYRYALLDYSLALSLPQESIVFCARSVDWVKSHFDAIKQSLPERTKSATRELMKGELKLPGKYLNRFFKIANETVIARHTGDPNRIRPPKIEEMTFCVVFNRMVLERFGLHLWHSLSNELPSQWKYPADAQPPSELFEAENSSLTKILKQILNSKLS
jgi:hypothetical protein